MELLRVAIDKIDPNPYQTRFALDENEIAALAEDIQRNGLLQPPTGRIIDASGKLLDGNIYFHKDYRVQLAFGHRRLAAYKLLAANHSEFLSMPLFYRLFDDETMAIPAEKKAQSCAEMMVEENQGLAINQRMASEATDYLVRMLITKDLRKFATYIDLQSGSCRSKYITRDAIEGFLK